MRIKGKRIFPLVLAFVICASSIAGAVFTVPVFALTLSAGGLQTTIASIIISLMLQCGVAPTNTNWINTLNNSYGVSSSIGTIENCITNGLLTETANGLMDTGLSSAIQNANAYSELALDEIFITTAQDAGVVANTAATNLANTAINVGTLGTIGAYAGAATIGVGAGVLINHLRENLLEYIRNGISIDNKINPNYSSYEKISSHSFILNGSTTNRKYINIGTNANVEFAYIYRTGVYFVNLENQGISYHVTVSTNNGSTWSNSARTASARSITKIIDSNVNPSPHYQLGIPAFDDANEAEAYLQGLLNGNSPQVYAPDIIGPGGNQTITYDQNGNIQTPFIQNQVPDNGDMNPVNMSDYLNFINDANNNTENGDVGQNQADLFDDFVSPYITIEPTTPEPEQPTPDTPNRPNIPEQPTIPDKPTVTDPEITESLGGATPDLKDVFPFCIPFDIFAIFTTFKVETRRAPVVSFTFIDGNNITIDLSRFDSLASLLRTLELILFIVGLAVATRKLIGAT